LVVATERLGASLGWLEKANHFSKWRKPNAQKILQGNPKKGVAEVGQITLFVVWVGRRRLVVDEVGRGLRSHDGNKCPGFVAEVVETGEIGGGTLVSEA
jgi:hypothetical protein